MLDTIYIFLLAMALWQGYKKGFVVALFSYVAIFVGLAAAMKLSATVAVWLQASTTIGAHWLPFISFALVMTAVTILVRWCASLIQQAIKLMMLGWFNKLAGIVLYMALYTTVYSVLLFYAKGFGILKPEALASSKYYAFIEPWGPKTIDSLGFVIPIFKDLFLQLQQYFGRLNS